MRGRENPPIQVDPEHPGTTETLSLSHTVTHTHGHTQTEQSGTVGASESSPHRRNTESSAAPGKSKKGEHKTLNGANVSGTWPDPDPLYTTKPLQVCPPHTLKHTPTVTGDPGATRVLFYPFLHAALGNARRGTTSKASRPGSVTSPPCRSLVPPLSLS